MTDVWAWWRAAVANPKAIGDTLKMTTTPEQGYYRRKLAKDGQWVPVALWFDEGQWFALRGPTHDQKHVDADREWEFCRAHPISLEEYDRVVAGGEWSDVNPVVHSQRQPPRPNGASTSDGALRPNDQLSESARLMSDITELKSEVRKFAKVTSDAMAGEAQSVRSRLLELFRQAEEIRAREKKPHWDAGVAVDKEWKPVKDTAHEQAEKIREAIAAYETEKLNAQRKAEAAAAKAEQERRDAETSFLPPDPATVQETPPPPVEAVAGSKVKGSYGRAASVGTEWVVVEVTDQDALYERMKARPEVKALLFDLAQAATKKGYRDIPGIKIEERATVR